MKRASIFGTTLVVPWPLAGPMAELATPKSIDVDGRPAAVGKLGRDEENGYETEYSCKRICHRSLHHTCCSRRVPDEADYPCRPVCGRRTNRHAGSHAVRTDGRHVGPAHS